MDPLLVTADAQERPKQEKGFRVNEFRWMLGLILPYRTTLLLGLVSTVLFATMHTISIGGAFPVFKILLEQEGLGGWIDRTIAGKRLDVEFAPLANPDDRVLRIAKIDEGSSLYSDGVRVGNKVTDVENRPALVLLHDLARAEPGRPFALIAFLAESGDGGGVTTLTPTPPGLEWDMRLLMRVGSLMPVGMDQDKIGTLKYLLVFLVIVVVLANVFRYFGEVLISKAVLRAMMNLRAKLYDRTLHLPMSYFAGRPTADLVTRFVQDVQEIQRGMLTLFGKFIREPLRAVFIFGLALALDWRITLTLLVVAPLAVLVFLLVGRSVKNANRKLLQAYGAMIGALTTSLQNLRVVKAYTAEDHERERLWNVDLRMFNQQLRLAKLRAFVTPMMETLAVGAGSFATVWLATRVLNQEMSLSKFAALGVTVSVLFDPLRKLSDVYVRLQRSAAGAERIAQILRQPIEDEDQPDQVELKPLETSIDFVNVSFTYPGAERRAVDDVTFSIQQGETVAIVGPNGCGKTTLVSMLSRLFDPDAGEIRYDGVDIRDAVLKSLRTQIGIVSQDAIVFAGTPVENIAYGLPGADASKAQDAARRAYADEFIRNIPGGYASNLGERGTTLSGGQRQRLAIARAIFRNAPILIFDEATSQIDTESELKIQTALTEFAKGRTTLIIAHRLSTIQFADRIVVMDAGRITDSGTHDQLFDRCPLYRSLCETQFVTQT